MKYIDYLKDNPVIVLDIIKYVLAALILFGLPIPPGLDVLVAGAVLAALTVVTRAKVTPNRKLPMDASAVDADRTVTLPAVR